MIALPLRNKMSPIAPTTTPQKNGWRGQRASGLSALPIDLRTAVSRLKAADWSDLGHIERLLRPRYVCAGVFHELAFTTARFQHEPLVVTYVAQRRRGAHHIH